MRYSIYFMNNGKVVDVEECYDDSDREELFNAINYSGEFPNVTCGYENDVYVVKTSDWNSYNRVHSAYVDEYMNFGSSGYRKPW